jgi:hypothetical protein
MKLGIIIALTLAACGYLGIAYVGAIDDCNSSKEKIARTLSVLQRPNPSATKGTPAEIQKEIESVRASLSRVQSIFPATINRLELVEKTLEIAGQKNITVSTVSVSENTRKTNERNYPVTQMSFQLDGSYDSIVSFLAALEGNQPETRDEGFKSLSIENVSILVTQDGFKARVLIQIYGAPEAIPRKVIQPAVKAPVKIQ